MVEGLDPSHPTLLKLLGDRQVEICGSAWPRRVGQAEFSGEGSAT